MTTVLLSDLFVSMKIDIGLMDSIGIAFNLSKCFLLIGYYYVVAREKKGDLTEINKDEGPFKEPLIET